MVHTLDYSFKDIYTLGSFGCLALSSVFCRPGETLFYLIVNNTQDMHSLMKKLRHTLEKQLRVWWDIATLETYIKAKMTPRRLRWELDPNDGITDPELMEEWYSFFNGCENELLHKMIKRRRFKLKGIEASISEIKNQLIPFVNQTEYKNKEKELQESIKKYDTQIQIKKQKKYKRDTLDYQSMNVYKWQTACTDPEFTLEDDVGIDDSPDTSMEMEMEGQMHNTPQQITRANSGIPYRQQQETPYRHPIRSGNRRDNYGDQLGHRTPLTPRYNVPIRNRFSPLRDNRRVRYGSNQEEPPQSYHRRDPRPPRDFPKRWARDRPPRRWKARPAYRNTGWRETYTDRREIRGEQHRTPEGVHRPYMERGYPREDQDRNHMGEVRHAQRPEERRRLQEEVEEGRRKRRREY